MDIQKIMAVSGRRIETGPVQIGNDWPGYFVRGDEVPNLAMMLRFLPSLMNDSADAAKMKAKLEQLAAEFESCRVA